MTEMNEQNKKGAAPRSLKDYSVEEIKALLRDVVIPLHIAVGVNYTHLLIEKAEKSGSPLHTDQMVAMAAICADLGTVYMKIVEDMDEAMRTRFIGGYLVAKGLSRANNPAVYFYGDFDAGDQPFPPEPPDSALRDFADAMRYAMEQGLADPAKVLGHKPPALAPARKCQLRNVDSSLCIKCNECGQMNKKAEDESHG